jgi:hypothetical protein
MGGQVMGRKGVNILGESVIAGLGIHPDSAQEGCAVAAGPDEVKRDDGSEERGNVSSVTACRHGMLCGDRPSTYVRHCNRNPTVICW